MVELLSRGPGRDSQLWRRARCGRLDRFHCRRAASIQRNPAAARDLSRFRYFLPPARSVAVQRGVCVGGMLYRVRAVHVRAAGHNRPV